MDIRRTSVALEFPEWTRANRELDCKGCAVCTQAQVSDCVLIFS